ncbi:transcription elongation factor, mitochondrial isoform X1 [Canis lupus familiaris]|uniref:transcription elongation factor, mitochondrial isoform X1 n=1 Tax=Canis lupus familiaris TaxID=9615 RepID=UPI00005A1D58|nr:transcription elongation factor, mitochondrial isoform X1 [Canis lupus familiaris]XP_025332272.1 transcription elongation factor, mitochondrial isoform X2 [Canis lupus dingo]XP_038404104.1 transcription elongation factor, mitochondrial isoform X1 [Canis lupus familiaris]XP_038533322.1 transcription elongation factor, mitochondrial isoform X1 [Canis lupus familiaris]|eukprot:XP_005624888.1 transcription elongation factor, mitochondrial isoform X2 [Canis lupus familiaris]
MSVCSLLVAGGRWRCFPVPLGSSLFQVIPNSYCRKKCTAPKKIIPNAAFCDEDTKDSGNELDKLFSSEQQASILHVLNTASNKELEAFRLLRGRKSVNIIEHREKFGPFQHLESLMNVPLFQYKTAIQVCNSILCPETEGKKRKFQDNRLLRKLIKPEIERERLKISSVISKIPTADFYVLEKIGLSIQNTSRFPLLLHFHIMEAMLYALLNKTFAQDGQHRVLSMNRNGVGKHFELMIGDTRTSGKELVKQLLTESVLKEDPRVVFPKEKIVRYRQMFSSTEQKRAEELYDSLLQAVAFYELAVFDTEP